MENPETAAPANRQRPSGVRFSVSLPGKIILMVVVVLCFSVIFLVVRANKATPFPPGVASELTFPVYFAKGAPEGYNYKLGSEKINANILFYTMAKGKKNIYITEQAAPQGTINLKSLPAHAPVSVPIGSAVIGTGLGNPSIVITAPSTLIQLTSNQGVTKDEILKVAQRLSTVE